MRNKNFTLSKSNLFSLLFFFLLSTGCKKVDELLDYALDFDGVFQTDTGWEATLDGESAGVYTKAGTPLTGYFHAGLGDEFCSSMVRQDETTWKGYVREGHGFALFQVPGKITIVGDVLTVQTDAGENYSLNRVAGTGTGTGGGGGTTPTTQVLVNQYVNGSAGDKKILRFTVPSNVKKMEVRTLEESSVNDYNTADMGVRRGSDPTVTKTPSYVWGADCYGIKPNREDEVCIFNNPTSGQWSVMLFGYNTYFISKLKVTLTF